MRHTISDSDRRFIEDLEAARIPPANFGHRAHVRAAYVYLTQHDTDDAAGRMRDTLVAYLRENGVDPAKYHETITRAWIMAVRHFMARTPPTHDGDAFIAANPQLLDASIMLTHYSKGRLFSDDARNAFIEPDLEPIPQHG